MANILVIEDEVNVSSFIKKGLEEEGNSVNVAYDGLTGLHLALLNEYDVIVLDIVLPQMNGIEVCRRYRRETGFSTAILMLSALGSTDNVVTGLESGADDYIVKPFKFRELLARISVMLRRKSMDYTSKIYEFADLTMDTVTKSVTRSNIPIKLTAKEFRLLELFITNPGRVLSKMIILENVWNSYTDLNTNVVEVYVNYLRNKIDKGYDKKLIHTMIGMGYSLKEE